MRNYQRRRKPFGGNRMNQSVLMRHGSKKNPAMKRGKAINLQGEPMKPRQLLAAPPV